MRTVLASLFLIPALGWGAEVGQTYQQLIAERGEPASRMDAGDTQLLRYPDATIKLKSGVITAITPTPSSPSAGHKKRPAPPQEGPPAPASPSVHTAKESKETLPLHLQLASLRRNKAEAELKVKAIVNQPVASVDRTQRLRPKIWGDTWFSDTAVLPDFAVVDVRATQEFPYSGHDYVSTPLNPGVAFSAKELEFNPMTRYFYSDLTVPKKRLSGPEMEEINRLYRTIADCEQRLKELTAATSPLAKR
ncbi:MAG TPA: hypothetical protein PLN52_08895 [Opitutaceae bacterium]|nr:hypothetical protein [Opitutaceae bacterium]